MWKKGGKCDKCKKNLKTTKKNLNKKQQIIIKNNGKQKK